MRVAARTGVDDDDRSSRALLRQAGAPFRPKMLYAIVLTTPPSTRREEPVVALAAGVQI